PQAAFFKSMFPIPNSGAGRYIYSPGLSLDTDKFDIKVSPRINDKNSIVSRYSFVNNTETDPAAYPALGFYPLRSRSQNVGLSFLHIFTPTLTWEVAGNNYQSLFYYLNESNFKSKDMETN